VSVLGFAKPAYHPQDHQLDRTYAGELDAFRCASGENRSAGTLRPHDPITQGSELLSGPCMCVVVYVRCSACWFTHTIPSGLQGVRRLNSAHELHIDVWLVPVQEHMW
jgi:hypothetical protein